MSITTARRKRPDRLLPVRRSWPWGLAGLLIGGLLAALMHAPASWLAAMLAAATDQRLLLAEPRGSLWSGSAVAVLTGGPGSRDASALPGRLRWTLGLAREDRRHLELRLRHPCCIGDQLRLRLEPGIDRLRVTLPAGHAEVGHWPAAWLSGLGAPFSTLRLGGMLRMVGDGLSIESVRGRWRVSGQAELEVLGLSSSMAPLDQLGSYRLRVTGDGDMSEGAQLTLDTLQGPLRMSGNGQWVGTRLRFRGQASADAGAEPMLNNLLNLMGQRQGALTLLAIG